MESIAAACDGSDVVAQLAGRPGGCLITSCGGFTQALRMCVCVSVKDAPVACGSLSAMHAYAALNVPLEHHRQGTPD